ncbi:unnamed protein product [Owenia fusiformis]|uniref:MTOR-associated protein MEAK7 n=1 Tax=Owenia fusiformis TaxID=6347 RepID=A0A8S4NGG4_OWEFU|nr:unnamed protein product [Owenia fusiformis]
MGTSQSKDPEVENALAVFSKSEQVEMERLFKKLSGPNSKAFSLEQLQIHLNGILCETIITRLHYTMANIQTQPELEADIHDMPDNSEDVTTLTTVTYDTFVISLAHLIKGDMHEKSHFINCLATETDYASPSDMIWFVTNIVQAYLEVKAEDAHTVSWQTETEEEDLRRFAIFILEDLFNKDLKYNSSPMHTSDVPFGVTYRDDELETWLSQSALFLHIIDTIFHSCFPVKMVDAMFSQNNLLPLCKDINWEKTTTILDIPSVLGINNSLPHQLQNQWSLLYTSQLHGESFSTMIKRVKDQGPTILVIRDTDGHIFGGFASESWTMKPQYSGDPSCFLFTMQPKLGIYTSTGYNDHYMYLNSGQSTMPYGLGMGGQFDYWGLWLDGEYGIGESRAEPKCTTYNSPQLSRQPEFQIDAIEFWAVGPDIEKEGGSMKHVISASGLDLTDAHVSILDKDPEAKAMLSLINRGPVSDGLREGDRTADTPEQHQLPPM